MKVVAFLPAKGTSERVGSKNTRLLNGKPLFLHTLEKLSECDFIDEVYLDSESDEILAYADPLGCKKIKRDASLATNATGGHALLSHGIDHAMDADIYLQVFGTSPFVKKETIKKGIDILRNSDEYDSVILARTQRHYIWIDGMPTYDQNHVPNTANLPPMVAETTGIYFIRGDVARKKRQRVGDRPFLLEVSPLEAIDIDYPEDFELAEIVSRGMTP